MTGIDENNVAGVGEEDHVTSGTAVVINTI